MSGFTREDLLAMAGDKVFGRGEAYARDGLILPLVKDESSLTAFSFGARAYRTTVTWDGKKLCGSCTCPAMGDFGLCKHWVATGLVWLDSGKDLMNALPAVNHVGLGKWPRDILEALVMQAAEKDPVLEVSMQVLCTLVAKQPVPMVLLARFVAGYARVQEVADCDDTGDWADRMMRLFEVAEILKKHGRRDELRIYLDALEVAFTEAADKVDAYGDVGILLETIEEYRAWMNR